MKLSIIIPSFKRAELLKWGLSSYLKQTFNGGYEILVLNEGVEDETEKLCNFYKNKGLPVRYIFTGQRNKDGLKWRIPGYAINIGAKSAKGEVIIISCPEIFIVDDCLQKMVDPILKNKKLITITKGYDDRESQILNILKKGEQIGNNITALSVPTLQVKFPFFMGINRERYISIGGYDEDFKGVCFDDNDIVERLIANGGQFQQLNARIVHLFHPRLRYGNKQIHKLWLMNQKLYHERKGTIIRNKDKDWGKI